MVNQAGIRKHHLRYSRTGKLYWPGDVGISAIWAFYIDMYEKLSIESDNNVIRSPRCKSIVAEQHLGWGADFVWTRWKITPRLCPPGIHYPVTQLSPWQLLGQAKEHDDQRTGHYCSSKQQRKRSRVIRNSSQGNTRRDSTKQNFILEAFKVIDIPVFIKIWNVKQHRLNILYNKFYRYWYN